MDFNLYYYDSILDAVVMRDNEDNELVIECAKANSQVIFDEPEDCEIGKRRACKLCVLCIETRWVTGVCGCNECV